MKTPTFFDAVAPIAVTDPLSALLGAAEGGRIEYRYVDAVKLAGHSCPTVAGVIASVAGLVTGAANDGGFKGLAGRFGRQGLLKFGVAMAGEIRFTRLENGSSVELEHFPQSVPRPTGLANLMRDVLAPQADAATHAAFAEAWQDWVRSILIDHADDPALIAVIA